MKRILSLALVIISLLTLLTACGKKDRILFVSGKYDEYLTLADYKSIKLDTSSDDFREHYEDVIVADIKNYNLYAEKKEGTVSEGDIANIDYVGKKDGVAFEGGTAQGYDLEIGSDTFIPGFEDGLIGAEIGKTVDLNLTFPVSYGNAELAGQDVVFTVTVNHVQTTEGIEPKDCYKDMGFKTLKQYENDLEKRATENFLLNYVVSNSKVKEYPKEDINTLKTQIKDSLENNISSYYGMSLEAYLTQSGMTLVEFESDLLNNQVKPLIKEIMPLYAILDEEGIEITSKDIDKKVKAIIKEYKEAGSEIDASTLKKTYGEYYFENLVVQEKAIEFLKENAKIK